MADKMREIAVVERRRQKKSSRWLVGWTWVGAAEGGDPMVHEENVRTRRLPAPELLAACEAVAKQVAEMLSLGCDFEFSNAKWGDEDKKSGERHVSVTILAQPDGASAPVAIPVNLEDGSLKDELLELETRAFAFADLKEQAQASLDLDGGGGA